MKQSYFLGLIVLLSIVFNSTQVLSEMEDFNDPSFLRQADEERKRLLELQASRRDPYAVSPDLEDKHLVAVNLGDGHFYAGKCDRGTAENCETVFVGSFEALCEHRRRIKVTGSGLKIVVGVALVLTGVGSPLSVLSFIPEVIPMVASYGFMALEVKQFIELYFGDCIKLDPKLANDNFINTLYIMAQQDVGIPFALKNAEDEARSDDWIKLYLKSFTDYLPKRRGIGTRAFKYVSQMRVDSDGVVHGIDIRDYYSLTEMNTWWYWNERESFRDPPLYGSTDSSP